MSEGLKNSPRTLEYEPGFREWMREHPGALNVVREVVKTLEAIPDKELKDKMNFDIGAIEIELQGEATLMSIPISVITISRRPYRKSGSLSKSKRTKLSKSRCSKIGICLFRTVRMNSKHSFRKRKTCRYRLGGSRGAAFRISGNGERAKAKLLRQQVARSANGLRSSWRTQKATWPEV